MRGTLVEKIEKIFAVLTGAILGAGVGANVGEYFACHSAMSQANLCDLVPIYLAAPIGAIIGAAIGWPLWRRGISF